MRHQKAGKKLGKTSSHRRAMFRNMVTSLFKHEQLVTTDAKAKQLRPIAEKMITLAKRGDLHARRQALSYMMDKSTVYKLFDEIKDRFLDRQGGYVRIVKKGVRKGDAAPISIIQLIPEESEVKKKKSKGKEAGKQTPKSAKSAKTQENVQEKTEPAAASSEADADKPSESAE